MIPNERHEASELRREFGEILALLAAGRTLVVGLPGADADTLLVWEWVREELEGRIKDLSIGMPRMCPGGTAIVELASPSVAGGEPVRLFRELPGPAEVDLASVLCARRRELMLHHGLLIPRAAVVQALERSPAAFGVRGRLGLAFDLLDEAVLGYRQFLIQLATSEDQAVRLEEAFARLARAIERVLSDRRPGPAAGSIPLAAAVLDFDRVVAGMGGSRRASVVQSEWVDTFAALRG